MPSGDDDDVEDPWTLYEERLSDLARWRDRKREIKQELLGETEDTENVIKQRFQRAVEIEESHNELVRTVCTGFGPRSTIYDETGWRLYGIEPLHELDSGLRNPDLIIGHPEREILVSVECKSGLSSPQNALEQIRDAADTLLAHHDYLADEADCQFSQIERVLCVPGPKADIAVQAIEQEEEERSPDEPILLWKVFRFDEETIQLHTSFSTRAVNNSKHDSQLAQMLDDGEGATTAEQPQVSPEVFPDTHPYVILETVLSEVLYEREIGDGSIQKFTRDEVFQYLNDPELLPHYAPERVAEEMTSDLIRKMNELDLIESTESEDGMGDGLETYKYKTSRRSVSTILNAVQGQYKNEWVSRTAEEEARERVVEEFRGEHTTLPDFVDQG